MKLSKIKSRYKQKDNIMTLEEYFTKAEKDSSMYSSPAERILEAIGEPEIIDTSKQPHLGRRFGNRTIKRYSAFKEFYGMEEVIEKIVSFFQHSAQGLEEKKQILYLLGPVGGGKSSLAEKLKSLIETQPFYAIEGSPIFESPLGILKVFPELLEESNIPERALPHCASPWLNKRLDELEGDLSQIKVIKMYPSQARQIAVTKVEPGDENNQDISTLVGKIDIRKLEHYAQDDPDAYRFNGGLCLGNRGILEFVEMFKAPIKVLNPLLTATQEGNYTATEKVASIPFDGIVLAHSNEAEWQTFRDNKNNEAFIDRIYIVKVPYSLSSKEEEKIYIKYINDSSLGKAPIAPHTLKLLAEYAVLTRLKPLENDEIIVKMKVYDGDNVKELYPDAKSYQQYKELSPLDEGFSGLSTRAAFKLLSRTFNKDTEEIAANPVHLLQILVDSIKTDDTSDEEKSKLLEFIQGWSIPSYLDLVQKDIQECYMDSYSEYAQHIFDRYLSYADAWIEDSDYRDPDTGQMYDRKALNNFLEEVEKPARIANPKDFRHEAVTFNLRYQAKHDGNSVPWNSHDKFREIIEAKLFTKTEDLLPQISFTGRGNEEDKKKHDGFIKRMTKKGYTDRQVRLITEYFQRHSKSK